MKTFDLDTRAGRYQARKAGLDVPKRSPGRPPKEFWLQVNKTDTCWLWTGRRNKDGYGIYRALGGQIRAHRYVLEHIEERQIQGKVVMHTCDNPACCNPAHLVVGSHADNQADKFRKGRQAKGEVNGSSVLTEAQVRQMRSKYKPKIVTYEMLAKEYGVSRDTVQKAVRGIYWSHIK